MSMQTTHLPTNSRTRILAWTVYDWANSSYSTLSITVLVAYLQRVVFPAEKWGETGVIVWAWGIALSMLCGALLSPIAGAMADARASKRKWLAGTAFTGAFAAALLGVVSPSQPVVVVILFFCANLMFELSLVFYNGFLPEIADDDEFNQVSAWGYSLGYVGGGLALAVVLFVMKFGSQFGLPDTTSQLRCGLCIMGIWWGVFTVPTVWVLTDLRRPGLTQQTFQHSARTAFADVIATLRNIRSFSTLFLFLLAFLLYNDGVQTVISQSSSFALQELEFTEAELAGVILMIQFLAVPGAMITALVADHLGPKPTLLACLTIWIGSLSAALFVHHKIEFWILGGVIGLVLGGTQSVSRALMSLMTPQQQSAQFFGFFNLTGKATSFLGTFLFGLFIAIGAGTRWAVFSILPFFLLGGIIVLLVNLRRGVEQRQLAERGKHVQNR